MRIFKGEQWLTEIDEDEKCSKLPEILDDNNEIEGRWTCHTSLSLYIVIPKISKIIT